jgi:hypothetical protein
VLLTHAWKSGDVSDGDVASDVTSHAMVIAITTIKRMVITVCHHPPVAWHGADLCKFQLCESSGELLMQVDLMQV